MENSAENTENKEVTPATEENSAPVEQPSLAEAVEESKEAIQSAEPVKRRGRPKKDPNAPAKEKSKKEAAANTPPPPVAPSIPPTFLKPVVNFPFQAAALKSGWPGWNLSDKEQEDNAVLLDLVIKRYAPQFQTEHPELFALGIGLGMAAVARYFAFREILIRAQNEQAKNPEANTASQEIARPQSKKEKLEKNKNADTVKPGSGLASFLDNGPQISPQI